jgi:hypothetical protein|tara:strand:+ start:713 stop:1006 length:294 start_codon:yes stop_codon:yes gene_type:complete
MPKYTIDFPADAVAAIKTQVDAEDREGLADKEVTLLWINRQLRRPLDQYTYAQDMPAAIADAETVRIAAEDALATEEAARATAEADAKTKAAGTVVT